MHLPGRGSFAAGGGGEEEVPLGVKSLCAELDVILQRQREEIQICVERWSALGIASLVGLHGGGPLPGSSCVVAPRLPPPEAPLMLVSSGGGGALRKALANEPPETADSPRSLTSTRSGSKSFSHETPPVGEEEPVRDPTCGLSPCLPGSLGEPPQPPACSPPPIFRTSSQLITTGGDRLVCAAESSVCSATDGDWSTRRRSFSDSDSEETPIPGNQASEEDGRRRFSRQVPQRLESSWLTSSNKARPSTSTLLLSPLSKKTYSKTSRAALESITRSHRYELASAVIIVLNAIFIVWETQRRSSLAALSSRADRFRDEIFFGIVANMFCLIFMVDLTLRILTERWHFLQSRDRGWNIFDTFVVATAALEAIVNWSSYSSSDDPSSLRMMLRKFSVLRILRFLRVVRVTRALKVIRIIRELRLMVFSLTASLRSLAWAVVMISFILLVFGIFFTDGVVSYCVRNGAMHAESTKAMRKYFGSVPAATVSLFMAMSGGDDWANMIDSLEPLPKEYTLLFLGFVCFAVLALTNVVTAVFINTALQRSQNDRELAVQKEMESKDELTEIIRQVFIELDANKSGALSLEEFERHIEDEKIMAYLKSRGIDIGQVRTLFTLLDVDRTGDVDMDEFVHGVLRLKGGATSMDLAILTYQVEWMLHHMMNAFGMSGQDGGSPQAADSGLKAESGLEILR